MTRQCGAVTSAPDAEPAQCYPSQPALTCNLCTRRRHGQPHPERLHVVIDGSAFGNPSQCALFIPRPVARSYAEAA